MTSLLNTRSKKFRLKGKASPAAHTRLRFFCFRLFQAREFDIHPDRESSFFAQPRQIFPHTAAVFKHSAMRPPCRPMPDQIQAPFLAGTPHIRWLAALGSFFRDSVFFEDLPGSGSPPDRHPGQQGCALLADRNHFDAAPHAFGARFHVRQAVADPPPGSGLFNALPVVVDAQQQPVIAPPQAHRNPGGFGVLGGVGKRFLEDVVQRFDLLPLKVS